MTASPEHFLVMNALKAATKPVTLRELESVCDLCRTTVRKYTHRFNENGRAYIADWVKTHERMWTPMWAWGSEPNVPKPPNVAPDRIRPPRGPRTPPKPPKPPKSPKSRIPPKARTKVLPVPERPYKTTFVGANPWGV